ncbi:MAG: hypothetical protein IJ087_19410, partial [Eggerthellaceae bacterium]|nr:hypothetical protein [Eggerthellaceae bacterium]
MNDDELMELFSAFDDVSAPESLQASTLDFIMSAAAAPAATDAANPANQAPTVTATRGGAKARIRNRWHAMRAAAVAACLALALTGGAAYAYPASTVLVTQGETTIELHVNVFGQVLSASASDNETQSIIDQMGLVNTPFSDSVSRVSDSLKENNPAAPVTVVMNGVPQPAEFGEKALIPQDENPQPAPNPVAADEKAVLEADAPVVSDESAPVVSAPVVRMETPVYLPEPTYGDSDDTPSESEGGNRPSTPEPSQPVQDTPEKPVVPAPDPDPDPSDVTPEPAQPVIVDD